MEIKQGRGFSDIQGTDDPTGCFNINQVLLWEKDFDRYNLTRWCRKGLLVMLRNEYYAFPEFRQFPEASRYVANLIYSPSYISLHSALEFYGMIPEEVVQITSVTTLKAAKFFDRIAEVDMLIIEDFGIKVLDGQQLLDFMELIEDRHARKSTIITSQLSVKNWYDVLAKNTTVADAVLDRLAKTAHRFELTGDSMRK